MDMSEIKLKLETGSYTDPWEFVDDVWLMFENAWIYNRKTSRVYKYCTKVTWYNNTNLTSEIIIDQLFPPTLRFNWYWNIVSFTAVRSFWTRDWSGYGTIGLLLRTKAHIQSANLMLLWPTKYHMHNSQRWKVLCLWKQVSCPSDSLVSSFSNCYLYLDHRIMYHVKFYLIQLFVAGIQLQLYFLTNTTFARSVLMTFQETLFP